MAILEVGLALVTSQSISLYVSPPQRVPCSMRTRLLERLHVERRDQRVELGQRSLKLLQLLSQVVNLRLLGHRFIRQALQRGRLLALSVELGQIADGRIRCREREMLQCDDERERERKDINLNTPSLWIAQFTIMIESNAFAAA